MHPITRRTWGGITAVTIGALALVACDADDKKDTSKAVDSPTATATATAPPPTGTPGGSGTPATQAPKSAKPSASLSSAGDQGEDCGPAPTTKPGHRIVYPNKAPSKDSLYYRDTKFVCDPNDGHYEPVGAEQTPLRFAAQATGTLSGPTPWKAQYLGQVWDHIDKCLAGRTDPGHPCSSSGAYEITLNAAGEISDIREIYHS
ncbi:hypothetical protein B4N89_22780 [Embleya scabrispora]|uniref:Uncharacterized protein n=1 Tax=Embleya scabrispora TaxID=159449 RepID=A0A1T3P2R5_9ACTN|nr:hypothetical protein [Embleya scabrispora]OPC83389.1 hypothetical protein B4N89_22780 [Embleya scabrispora]